MGRLLRGSRDRVLVAARSAAGAIIGAINGHPVLRSAFRQVIMSALAAKVTFGIGLIGASVS